MQKDEKSWHSIQNETTVTDVLKMAVLLLSVLMGLAGTIALLSSLSRHPH